MAADVPELVATIARALADDPDQVRVTETTKGRQRVVQLTVAPDDMGRVIGRDGRVANAIRALLSAAVDDDEWGLEIVD
ncbi:MAG: KH domain-containing protein [Anaerolineae bacterium]|jgi:hypothetical protein